MTSDNKNTMEIQQGDETIRVNFQQRRVVIQERYEWLHIVNDLMLGLWFIVGSFMFFSDKWTYWGTWLFVAGSAQMMIGPLLRIAHKIHMRKFNLPSIHF